MAPVEHFDVIVLGAGISGIGAAHHLKNTWGAGTFVVLERREMFGGTWDIFRYPGIRTDSDMFTFGYEHRPWPSDRPIAERAEILAYLRGAIVDGGLDEHIRYGEEAISAVWESEKGLWTLTTGKGNVFTCRFLQTCLGFYEDEPYKPVFEGADDFTAAGGTIIHPYRWPEGHHVSEKRIAVVGSGATAITLIPSLTKMGASHVTMVQRSPGYIVPMRNSDPIAAAALKEGLPLAEMHSRVREAKAEEMQVMRQVRENRTLEQRDRAFIKMMRNEVPKELMDDEEFKKHFTPRYNVWQQRLCLAPDSDFFQCLRARTASVVTGTIDKFDNKGILMKDGTRVDCDIIVTATGFILHQNMPMGAMKVVVDGVPYRSVDHAMYKDCMLSDMPNFMFVKGYQFISWTMKVDLVCKHLCRLLEFMQEKGIKKVVPKVPASGIGPSPGPPMNSGYIQRSVHTFTKHGSKVPWAPLLDYTADKALLLQDPVEHDCLELEYFGHQEQHEQQHEQHLLANPSSSSSSSSPTYLQRSKL